MIGISNAKNSSMPHLHFFSLNEKTKKNALCQTKREQLQQWWLVATARHI